jgi:hypothetical protein
MGGDVLKVIDRGNALGAAFQAGMGGDIFDQLTVEPDAAPIPEAFEIFFSSTYRHFLNSPSPADRSELSDSLNGCQFAEEGNRREATGNVNRHEASGNSKTWGEAW